MKFHFFQSTMIGLKVVLIFLSLFMWTSSFGQDTEGIERGAQALEGEIIMLNLFVDTDWDSWDSDERDYFEEEFCSSPGMDCERVE